MEGRKLNPPLRPDLSSHTFSDQSTDNKKLKAFSIGAQKKSPFQKHREEEEQKKKRAEDEAAAVYAEFVKSFKEENNAQVTKTFIRGETVLGETRIETVPNAGKEYKPQPIFTHPKIEPPIEDQLQLQFEIDSKKERRTSSPKNIRGQRKKRNIDELKEEFEKRQERSDKKKVRSDPAKEIDPMKEFDDIVVGSYDTGDPNTTNLYVGNLSPQVTEELLFKEFGKYGQIASIKIMWPRTDDERRRNRNCGFVSFMDREGAEKAKETMQGSELQGHEIRIGWGKAVPRPPQALTIASVSTSVPTLPWAVSSPFLGEGEGEPLDLQTQLPQKAAIPPPHCLGGLPIGPGPGPGPFMGSVVGPPQLQLQPTPLPPPPGTPLGLGAVAGIGTGTGTGATPHAHNFPQPPHPHPHPHPHVYPHGQPLPFPVSVGVGLSQPQPQPQCQTVGGHLGPPTPVGSQTHQIPQAHPLAVHPHPHAHTHPLAHGHTQQAPGLPHGHGTHGLMAGQPPLGMGVPINVGGPLPLSASGSGPGPVAGYGVHGQPLLAMAPQNVPNATNPRLLPTMGYVPPQSSQVVVVMPTDPDQNKLICRLASYILKQGHQFEQLIMERERTNPKFQFLFQVGSLENNFYRWKVYSLLHGDQEDHWRTSPFQMYPQGPFWFPPPLQSSTHPSPPLPGGPSTSTPLPVHSPSPLSPSLNKSTTSSSIGHSRVDTDKPMLSAYDSEEDRSRPTSMSVSPSQDREWDTDKNRNRNRNRNRDRDRDSEPRGRSRHRDRDRDRDRYRDRDQHYEEDSDHDRDRERDRDQRSRSRSNRGRDRDHSRDRDRDRDSDYDSSDYSDDSEYYEDRSSRERDHYRDREHSRDRYHSRDRSRDDREREKDRSRHQSQSQSRSRDRERERDRDWDRERDRGYSRETSRHTDKDYSRDRDRDREQRDRKKKDKHPFSRDRDKDRGTGSGFASYSDDRRKGKGLSDALRDSFEDMLRGLNIERQKIKEAMAFALDHAEQAGEIVQVITESLTLLVTPITTKIARLFLVSDILHNSSALVPNASAYRTCFEAKLPLIFESLNETFRNITGRFTSDHLKEQVMRVLGVWEEWSLYPQSFLNGLQATFFMTKDREFIDVTATVDPLTKDDIDGEPLFPGEDMPTADLSNTDIETLSTGDLERLCKTHGVAKGSHSEMVSRLLMVEKFSRKKKEHEFSRRQPQSEESPPAKPLVQAQPTGTPPRPNPDDDENIDGCPVDEDEDLDGAPIDLDDPFLLNQLKQGYFPSL